MRVAFLRAADALALPEPEAGGAAVADLCTFANTEDDDALALLWAWLVCAARPGASFPPILLLYGEQGSDKTAAARRLPREDRDAFISAMNWHIVAFDNVSTIGESTSDSLCRIATGCGFSTRGLNADADEVIFSVTRLLLLNGIPSTILGRYDLPSRAINVELRPLRLRRQDAELVADFARLRPGLLGLLCDGVSSALRSVAKTKISDPPRMMDACTWAEAAAPGLGIEPGRIAAAWRANRNMADRAALEVDDVAQAIVRMLAELQAVGRGAAWKGSPRELYRKLSDQVGERIARGRLWPQNPSGMGNKMRRIAPGRGGAGRGAVYGIEAAHGKGGADGSRWGSVRRV